MAIAYGHHSFEDLAESIALTVFENINFAIPFVKIETRQVKKSGHDSGHEEDDFRASEEESSGDEEVTSADKFAPSQGQKYIRNFFSIFLSRIHVQF